MGRKLGKRTTKTLSHCVNVYQKWQQNVDGADYNIMELQEFFKAFFNNTAGTFLINIALL